MTGLIVAWDEDEIQAVDEENFESIVVEVVDSFFDSVEGYSNVEIEWKAGAWDHGSQYLVDEEPVKQIIEGGYSIVIRGQSRDGVYKINLNTDGLYIEKASTEQKRELDYLKMRAPPEVTIAPETKEVFVKKIPKQIRKRVVRSLPSVTN